GIRDWSVTGVQTCALPILLLLSPSVARRLAPAGWTKDAIRQHLYDNARIEFDWFERYQLGIGGKVRPFAELIEGRPVEPQYRERSEERRVGKEGRVRGRGE